MKWVQGVRVENASRLQCSRSVDQSIVIKEI